MRVVVEEQPLATYRMPDRYEQIARHVPVVPVNRRTGITEVEECLHRGRSAAAGRSLPLVPRAPDLQPRPLRSVRALRRHLPGGLHQLRAGRARWRRYRQRPGDGDGAGPGRSAAHRLPVRRGALHSVRAVRHSLPDGSDHDGTVPVRGGARADREPERRRFLRWVGQWSVVAAIPDPVRGGGAPSCRTCCTSRREVQARHAGGLPEGVTFDADHRLFVVRERNQFHVISATARISAAPWSGSRRRASSTARATGASSTPTASAVAGPAPRPLPWYPWLSRATGSWSSIRRRRCPPRTASAPAGTAEDDPRQRLSRLWRGIDVDVGARRANARRARRSSRTSGCTGFPTRSRSRSARWSYRLWLGTSAAFLFLILIVTGVLLMFFYVPSIEQAYWSIKDIHYVVGFGWLLRNQHRWAAHLMVRWSSCTWCASSSPAPTARTRRQLAGRHRCCCWRRCCSPSPATSCPGTSWPSGR